MEPTESLSYGGELQRKALHLLALVVPLGMAWMGKPGVLYLLIPMALLALSADILRVRSRAFSTFIDHIFGRMMRQEERPGVGDPVSINGATWVLVSAALLAIIFPISIAVPAFIVFMIGDAAAALFGRRYGRVHWGKGPRTLEGSAAFLVVGLLIIACYPGMIFWVGAIGVVVACAAEAMPGPFNDNIRVPLLMALVLFLLERYALGNTLTLFL